MDNKIINADELIKKQAEPVAPPKPVSLDTIAANTSDGELKQLISLLVADQARAAAERNAALQRKEESRATLRAEVTKSKLAVAHRQNACVHRMNGDAAASSAIFGQVHSDGKYHPICVVCQKEFPPRDPRGNEIETSVQMA